MTPPEIEKSLESMTVLVDTREQETLALRRRLDKMPCPKKRAKLPSGDYSAKCTLPDGTEFSLENKIAVERKMSVDEICANFCRGRERFKNEFDRFHAVGGKLYILVEDACWEKIFANAYETKMSPESLAASLLAWSARYNAQIVFCDAFYSGILIYKILYSELREHLKRLD